MQKNTLIIIKIILNMDNRYSAYNNKTSSSFYKKNSSTHFPHPDPFSANPKSQKSTDVFSLKPEVNSSDILFNLDESISYFFVVY